jgi:hypothetical protein
MATYYVSASGDNSDGTTWAKAYTTLVGAYTAQSAAGHTYVVDSTHSESGASLNLAIPGTIVAPSRVLGATNTGSAVVAADLVNAKGGGTGPLFFSTTTSRTALPLAGRSRRSAPAPAPGRIATSRLRPRAERVRLGWRHPRFANLGGSIVVWN